MNLHPRSDPLLRSILEPSPLLQIGRLVQRERKASTANVYVVGADALARRDGRRGVGARRSRGEAGELLREDPVERRVRRDTDPSEGKLAGTSGSLPISTRLERRATLARPPRDPGCAGPSDVTLPVAHSGSRTPHVANACLEELDAGNLHVRIRGGPGKATTRGYPTSNDFATR